MLLSPMIEESFVATAENHRPVMLEEVLELLAPVSGQLWVDGTLGAGGHTIALLKAVGPGGRVIGIDRDPLALAMATERLSQYGPSFVPCRGEHERIRELLRDQSIDRVDGILLDLGVSSMQLDQAERGFSFRNDAPLDMRMDPDTPISAATLLRELDAPELREILWRYGEERRAGAIARAIVARRDTNPITRTLELAELVSDVLGPRARRFRIHPATRTFQALRIAVNGEIVGLATTVHDAIDCLRPGGRLAVIAYHSLESRAVKHAMRDSLKRCICPRGLPVCACGMPGSVLAVTGKAVRPTPEEIADNPRARSAQLRVVERL